MAPVLKSVARTEDISLRQWSVKCSHESWVYKWAIDPVMNPNPVYSHTYTWQYVSVSILNVPQLCPCREVLLTRRGVWGASMEPICPNMTQATSRECRSCVGNSSALYTYITVYEIVMANFPAKKSSRRSQSKPVTHRANCIFYRTEGYMRS
jgi:hypothetical protein